LNLLTGHEIFISRSETSKKLLLPWGLKKTWLAKAHLHTRFYSVFAVRFEIYYIA